MRSRWFRLAAARTRAPMLAAAALLAVCGSAQAVDLTITPGQRSTAQQVAQTGVPLSELAPNAPDSHTVQRGDTLWDISKLFLKSPWRWPELWGMNLEQIRNPHLIYPGQVLVLVKVDGRATLRLAQPDPAGTPPTNTVKLSPRIRSELLDNGAIASIPLHLIVPFLNEAIVMDADELADAPRIVAAQEGRVMLSRGETAYVRGDLKGARDFRLFRESRPLKDPGTEELLGYEAAFVGTAEYTRPGELRPAEGGKVVEVPASFRITGVRQEAGIGDRLAPVPQRDYSAYAPHAPTAPMAGQIVSIYGEALTAGQNQIVALNRGTRDGLERGHVLALWRNGPLTADRTDGRKVAIKLPDERIGLLFVFRVFDRVSYALILTAIDPVSRGDRFTQP
ncbi:LysM peptidoglycan-binding domain-containing protein [Aquincola sp. S2]|uniref:LysM peptidoglycan-binding domain-containing protein n=1 Tax=Pseudaquabacterium terrae TaxID=2732868 RepID=A0ABX2EDC7_9BURK|nr:LysM domain-containing protein [Aquabacterium terrae]NRF66689.1 LysM peptidoglycan-binding domain-containing protein [Aquabacterium terrae]